MVFHCVQRTKQYLINNLQYRSAKVYCTMISYVNIQCGTSVDPNFYCLTFLNANLQSYCNFSTNVYYWLVYTNSLSPVCKQTVYTCQYLPNHLYFSHPCQKGVIILHNVHLEHCLSLKIKQLHIISNKFCLTVLCLNFIPMSTAFVLTEIYLQLQGYSHHQNSDIQGYHCQLNCDVTFSWPQIHPGHDLWTQMIAQS